MFEWGWKFKTERHFLEGSVEMRFTKWVTLFILPAIATIASANTIDVTQTVLGTQGPWTFSGSLNSAFQYGTDSELAPVVLNASDGFDFAAGGAFTITYLSGTVSVGSGFPFTDPFGDTSVPVDNGFGSSGRVFPSFYMSSFTYPINLGELVGTFATSSGAIVGMPFEVGDSATVTVPAGATQLQLGINDDIYGDNVGSYTVRIAGPALPVSSVPEPSTLPAVGAVLAFLALFSSYRNKRTIGQRRV
jgi:hypothetical protein